MLACAGWRSKVTYQVVQERVVDDTQDGAFLVDETEGDATEWETMDKVGGTI